MGRSLGEMNSGAEKAKGVTGLEGIIPPAAGKRFEEGVSKGPSKEKVLERFLNETPISTAAPASRKPIVAPKSNRGAVPSGQQRARTRDVIAPFHELHKTYSTLINNARSMNLSDEHHDALDVAAGHLMNSAVSYHKAMSEGGLHTNNMNVDTAHGHLQDAVEHLSSAHNTIVDSGVHATMSSRNLSSALPTDDKVADLVGKSQTLERQGVGGVAGKLKPYKRGVLGRTGSMTYNKGQYSLTRVADDNKVEGAEFGDKAVNDMSKLFGRDHPGVQKLIAMRGTPRGQKLRVSKEERREGVTEATGAGTATGSPRNPKARGTGRRIDTRFNTDSNPSGNTGGKPKF
jgi:hypothetical protein